MGPIIMFNHRETLDGNIEDKKIMLIGMARNAATASSFKSVTSPNGPNDPAFIPSIWPGIKKRR
ncbi:hypothetical protein JCM17845_28840 [Iodidimonas gelatinilytica]|uniref:Uncharacterized protein n=1 Tax=Iodidimonas gelatinilytica TaxID=1236966 RepID=A0A5A7N1V4_9PROT|nr:hypothetical protein JCM17845_28840 [Iodidimonas gelatinilytica]